MARPVNHNTGSELVTGAWETAKGAAVGALSLPLVGAVLGVVGGAALGAFMLSGVGTGAMIAAGVIGAAVGGVGGTAAGGAVALTPVGWGVSGVLAAIGGLIGLGHGANKISEEKAAYQSKQLASQRMGQEERSLIANQNMHHGYLAGFQEGAAMGEQQAFAKMQQAVQEQAAAQPNTLMGQKPVEGHHVHKLGRAGHQNVSKADMIANQKEHAAEATPQVGG